MEPRKLLEIICVAEKLKDELRHCYTKNGRQESVAEHSWMTTLIAFFLKDIFPEVDMDKVIKMCIIHDLGEVFTGDVPVFEKTKEHNNNELKLLYDWFYSFPDPWASECVLLYDEINNRKTMEAKIFKAIDSLEALIQHNISDLSTWIPKEYELNKTYADDKVQFSKYLMELREEIRKDTFYKLNEE